MKRLVLCVLLVVATVVLLGFVVMFEVDDWRYPSGPQGEVRVHYMIPVTMENGKKGDIKTVFSIAGHVGCVQIVPTSGHNEYGFVMLYIKTTEGWYETPTASLGGPIDWERGVKVEFTYPEGMVLRKQTRSPFHGYYPVNGWLRWRGSPFGFGNHLDEGDIASVQFRHPTGGREVTVRRTTGLEHGGFQSWGADSGMAVEVTVSDKEPLKIP